MTVTDLHRPHVDELTRPNPDDPTGQSTMRRVPEVLDCWFESGSMPFAQVHYPFENTRVVRAPLPGRLHRRVHRPDPRLVLHAPRPRHGAVRPAQFRHVRQPRHRARRRRAEDVEEPEQLSRPDGRCSTATAPTRCGGTCCRRRSCAATTRWSPRPASATRSATCCSRCGTRGTSWRCTPTPPTTGASTAHRLDRTSLDQLHPVEDPRPRRRRHRHDGRLRPVRRLPARPHLPRRAHQLVRAAQPLPLLAGRPRRDRHDAHRARRS